MRVHIITCLILAGSRSKTPWSSLSSKQLPVNVFLLTASSLADALAFKFGYRDIASYTADAQKCFSLLESRLIDYPSARLLLVNVSISCNGF
jgi:hypothetical protein